MLETNFDLKAFRLESNRIETRLRNKMGRRSFQIEKYMVVRGISEKAMSEGKPWPIVVFDCARRAGTIPNWDQVPAMYLVKRVVLECIASADTD